MRNQFIDKKTRKVFIVTPGRTGSSLFCAILAKSGANFGGNHITNWDRKAGAYELRSLHKAAGHSRLAKILAEYSKIDNTKMLSRKWHRAMTQYYLRRSLQNSDYCKVSDSDLARWALHMGYKPKVLVIYRDFNEYCISSFLRRGGSYMELANHYSDSLESGLMAMLALGGCLVNFNELTDTASVQWAKRVSTITGLDEQNLIANRSKLLSNNSSKQAAFSIYPTLRVQYIHDELSRHSDEICSG